MPKAGNEATSQARRRYEDPGLRGWERGYVATSMRLSQDYELFHAVCTN